MFPCEAALHFLRNRKMMFFKSLPRHSTALNNKLSITLIEVNFVDNVFLLFRASLIPKSTDFVANTWFSVKIKQQNRQTGSCSKNLGSSIRNIRSHIDLSNSSTIRELSENKFWMFLQSEDPYIKQYLCLLRHLFTNEKIRIILDLLLSKKMLENR